MIKKINQQNKKKMKVTCSEELVVDKLYLYH